MHGSALTVEHVDVGELEADREEESYSIGVHLYRWDQLSLRQHPDVAGSYASAAARIVLS